MTKQTYGKKECADMGTCWSKEVCEESGECARGSLEVKSRSGLTPEEDYLAWCAELEIKKEGIEAWSHRKRVETRIDCWDAGECPLTRRCEDLGFCVKKGTPKKEKETCKNCRFSYPMDPDSIYAEEGEDQLVYCREDSPKLTGNGYEGWPKIYSKLWCGKWKPKT